MKITVTIAIPTRTGLLPTMRLAVEEPEALKLLANARIEAMQNAAAFGYQIHPSAHPDEVAFGESNLASFTFTATPVAGPGGLEFEDLGGGTPS